MLSTPKCKFVFKISQIYTTHNKHVKMFDYTYYLPLNSIMKRLSKRIILRIKHFYTQKESVFTDSLNYSFIVFLMSQLI